MEITLANLPEATEQEVFDQVVDHLLTQMKKSEIDFDMDRDNPMCVYRGKNGLKCAAGCLISDEEYKDCFEGNEWRSLVQAKRVPGVHLDLIKRLQELHDDLDPDQWESSLKILACEKDFQFNWKGKQ